MSEPAVATTRGALAHQHRFLRKQRKRDPTNSRESGRTGQPTDASRATSHIVRTVSSRGIRSRNYACHKPHKVTLSSSSEQLPGAARWGERAEWVAAYGARPWGVKRAAAVSEAVAMYSEVSSIARRNCALEKKNLKNCVNPRKTRRRASYVRYRSVVLPTHSDMRRK